MKIITKVLLSASLVFPLAASPSYAAEQNKMLEIVSNGKPQTVIVTPDKPSPAAALGSKVLAEHIRQISGAQVQILTESSLGNSQIENKRLTVSNSALNDISTFILVGESSLAGKLGVTSDGLGAGGIRMRTTENAIVLLGADNADKRPTIEVDPNDSSQQTTNDRNASLYAVTKFLEEQFGVRYLWPGESGKVIPQKSTLSVSSIDISYTPTIKQRHIRSSLSRGFSPRSQVGLTQLGVDEKDYPQVRKRIDAAEQTESISPNWYVWQRLGGSMGLKTGHSFGYAWEKYGKEHPEWFAMQPNGSRDQSASPDRSRFCVSNKELQAAIARDRIEELDRNPQQMSVSIDPNDGGYNVFCTCEECKKLDPPGAEQVTLTWTDRVDKDKKTYTYQRAASLTDRMVYFWNGIAEQVVARHPDALLTVRAYSAYVNPPVMRKLHPNIAVEQVSGDYFNPDQVQKQLENWTQWGKFTQYLAWRPNIDTGSRRHGLPVVYVHRMGENVKARVKAGMVSTDIDSMQKNWSPNSLNLYVLAQLLWDPSQDVDAIVNDYCESGFGAGAPFIKKYFSQIEKITLEAADAGAASPEENYRGRLMIDTLAELYDPATLKELHGLLDQAGNRVQGDKAILDRIEFLRTALFYAEVQAQAFRMVNAARDDKEKIDKKAILPFMEKRYRVMRYIFLNQPTAFDIPYLLWGSEGNFRALQSKESWKILADGSDDEVLKIMQANPLADADEFGVMEEIEDR